MEGTRLTKVARQIQKDLGEIFQRQSKSLFQGRMITVTTVRVSPDLSVARVYLSIFPTEKKEEVFELIKQSTKTIRHELAQRIRNQMRIVPELAFFIDDSLDYIENIDRLLKE
ncbi:MAG: 30S ribosome-binding factor RbfA [Tenuifilaceae bacterium]|nr:30S ribosome-binding factor RbfA [Bacteroidales bacterium]MDI9516111.1 30S ribosome-binding factor RbfA [Bacteroidota bacterium]NLH55669.1 30S ribosome-binding factor RbfA [Rikenellaceae bacterium]OQC63508.1 MAG: Ribosome-binding factor A [Bacteroidetes bacterium ADurb.Bin008]HNV81324.1 30S ribosome-binding factor RbfA [Tenuifilaceae bacterium]